ncbi:MAG: hypothetical protein Q8Q10_04735 [bacterium]|nr:hypothetical protein [bacterium]
MAISIEVQNKLVSAYLQDNLSMAQVGAKFNVSPSAVVYYLNKNKVSRRSRSDAITQLYITKFHKKPVIIKGIFSKKEEALRLAGVMLYWAEGCKGWSTVKFVNSDPSMIKLFLSFLRKICGIWEDRLKLLIHMYPDHNENELIDFWSRVTKVPRQNFYKSFIHSKKKGTYKKKSLYGTLCINYSDKKLLTRINSWIGEYKEKF